MQIQENIPLAPYTTFKIGGPARYFVEAETVDHIAKAVAFAKKQNLPYFVIGEASNILISENGFAGVVVKIANRGCVFKKGNKLSCGAGAPISKAVDMSIERGLAGLDWAGGLPGTVGGAVRGNAGAFGGETKDVVFEVGSLGGKNAAIPTYRSKVNCKFGYRDSIFKHNNEIVFEATFVLKPGDKQKLRAIASDHIAFRKKRHPLEYGNAGSIFKNTPVDSLPKNLKENWSAVIKNDPFPVVPTAKIIADAGLASKQVGQAQVSTKHTNYIVNLGGATANDVKQLIEIVKKTVKDKFDVALDVEVQIL